MSASRPVRRRQVNALQAIGLMMAFVLVAVTGGVLASGLLMPAVASTSALAQTTTELFDELPGDLATPPLSQKSTILAADGSVLAEFYDQNRIVVPLDDISDNMRNAVIDVEDRRFYEHGGVDLRGMTRAFLNNALSQDTEGASTLTQQYVKNMLIQSALRIDDPQQRAQAIADAKDASGAEGYARKLREAKLAISLEQRMTKDQILEGYLNIAQFGASVYGVEAAAQLYFSVSAKDLDYLQAATIAGVTKSPIAYDPQRNPEKSETRRNEVLHDMLREGDITQEEYDTGIATPIADTLKLGQTKLGCSGADKAVQGSGYFCDYVTKILATDPVFGETAAERRQKLYQGGLTIRTTLDRPKQDLAVAAVQGAVPQTDPSGVGVAMSVVEPGTGKILAMAQNRTYDTQQDPEPGHTAVNFNTDQAYGGSQGFQPGSTFKPFTLLEWLKEGRALREVVDGTPQTWKLGEFDASSCGVGFANTDWKLRNSEGGAGFMTVLDATRNSVNNAFADMASQVDLCGIFQGAQDLGVHTGSGNDLTVTPANVIGTDYIAPLTMASAFAAFSADGVFCTPIAIESITDADGNDVPVPDAGCHQAITPELARAVTYALSFVWTGTAKNVPRLSDNRPASGKTGTTSENEHTWFVGFTRQMATAVWVGHPDGTYSMHQQTINGKVYWNGPYGSSIAAPAWRAFMEPASQGMEVLGFTAPPSSMINGVQRTVPRVTGMSPSAASAAITSAGFHVKIADGQVYSDAPAGTIGAQSPGGGSRAVRGSVVTLSISKGPEPTPTPTPSDNNGNNNGNDKVNPPGRNNNDTTG
ncbi:penicillin-binding protein [Actinotalea sp. M2MS4P-6]|uniref:penicillin-binding protein n=1 Tax=Actinotalea sp. M2MS4P-6 TaxID=2983762 RepID=UPI0021E4EE45|nr:penicillin-binding protein [Actinotalea sp. M2MS4P-6]MCV2393179.1 penicillin-binding protein [Actinotalea sp. M2MS4P-6]